MKSFFTAILALTVIVSACFAQEEQTSETLRFMTYNVRHGDADDGENHWDMRKGMFLRLLASQNADVIGMQEVMSFQLDEITDALKLYGNVSTGRDDGKLKGEHCSILYRADRFTLLSAGTFWLSDTPEKVASSTWGNGITRICSWARLAEKKSGRSFYVFNTHYDHISAHSQVKSSELIAKKIDALPANEPVILMGDFNAVPGSEPIEYLNRRYVNTFLSIHPNETDAASFNNWKPIEKGSLIDNIFARGCGAVKDAHINRTNVDGKCPSDHYPVVCDIVLQP
ncbi:MAG: endonuclease/exonuclease/phosphatase family protein [Phycisphaerae bacterium]